MNDIIAAIATPPGKGGVGIVRISGSDLSNVALKIIGKLPPPRFAHFCQFKNNDEIIDEGLALFFKAPHSFTGEDVLELQGHGGPVVMDQLLQAIIECGVRIAEPGEFSKRAFMNNKLDLAQAEAIADLIDASSAQAAKAAFKSLQGEFSILINTLVAQLIHLRTYIEASIDFVDEEIDLIAEGNILLQLEKIQQKLNAVLQQANQGQLLQEGMTVVIAGRPNAGKSSLLNQLTGRDSAIVTNIPGTTRDVLREFIQIDGLPVHIIDTAGLRLSNDVVEQEGVKRAKQAIAKADLLLYLRDIAVEKDNDWQALLTEIENCPPIVLVNNKIDKVKVEPAVKKGKPDELFISIKQQYGVKLLTDYIKQFIGYKAEQASQFTARRRHIDAINRAQQSIDNALQQLKQKKTPELVAEDLRQAQHALSEITGEFSTDDLLGKIFSTFCIGK
ncbi:MAG: tRNA uridine-5-carboxymethylaminomethyl(34) synthesis GTPase MnmE [Gammaproteobacteria bacterium RIFCSPHIGHO2_12_FULL_41_15]|nr:MAG: tRNA uridine-5-carboxymethylaminomethyl(34) synthesis GTPase MnmE [Gammaproteobacteria bacterium RIFCSPHIGHO2_12_FULL_41_15]